jgi:hypothetical protein
MPSRPPGRPKASNPHDVRVTIRLTEREADVLQRLATAQGTTLSATVRACVAQVVAYFHRGHLRDTQDTQIARELRKVRRALSPEADALLDNFTLEEPAEGTPLTTVVLREDPSPTVRKAPTSKEKEYVAMPPQPS